MGIKILIGFLHFLFIFPGFMFAEEKAPEVSSKVLKEITTFLSDHVIDKKFVTEQKNSPSQNPKSKEWTQYFWDRKSHYSNLKVLENGFMMNYMVDVTFNKYKLDESKNPIGDSTETIHEIAKWEISFRKIVGHNRLYGYMKIIPEENDEGFNDNVGKIVKTQIFFTDEKDKGEVLNLNLEFVYPSFDLDMGLTYYEVYKLLWFKDNVLHRGEYHAHFKADRKTLAKGRLIDTNKDNWVFDHAK